MANKNPKNQIMNPTMSRISFITFVQDRNFTAEARRAQRDDVFIWRGEAAK
jgi:hypothetical protein